MLYILLELWIQETNVHSSWQIVKANLWRVMFRNILRGFQQKQHIRGQRSGAKSRGRRPPINGLELSHVFFLWYHFMLTATRSVCRGIYSQRRLFTNCVRFSRGFLFNSGLALEAPAARPNSIHWERIMAQKSIT